MTNSTKYEINSIITELNSIINEIYSVSNGVGKDFEGIGNEICANSIKKVGEHYEGVVKKLRKMDLTILTDGTTVNC